MAKRKRASLKDKSPETLGLTPKKGKGIDLLFGGPSGKQEPDTASQPASQTETDDEAGGLANNDTSVSAPSDSSQPDIATDDGRLVDELGLPVAMEAPPDDLILASSPTDSAVGTEQEDTVNLSTSPFAMPVSESSGAETAIGDVNDLSGILEEDNLPLVEEDTLSSSVEEQDLSGLVEPSASSGTAAANDLSGIVDDDDLSGLGSDESASDLSGLVVEDTPGDSSSVPAGAAETPAPETATDLSGIMSDTDTTSTTPPPASTPSAAPPPTTAAPINAPPPPSPAPSYQPASPTTPYSSASPSEPAPGYTPPPSSAGATQPSSPSNIELEGLSEGVAGTLGAFGESVSSREDFIPKDELPDQALTVTEREQVERDDAITQKVLQYIGSQRRDELFEEIRALHDRVANQLSANKTDVSFALETLREANDIIIEDPRQYDEALYRVALVKTMLVRKETLNYWSYRMGLFILLYGILFTVLCILGYFAPIDFNNLLRGEQLGPIFEAVWFAGLAGGLGGSVEIFWRLYYRVSIKQDFDPQYLMYYLVKPILGFVLGLVMYFLVAISVSLFGSTGPAASLPQPGTETGFLLAIFLGFIAGYRQESVFDMIYVLVKKISPEAAGGGSKSVIPVEEEEFQEAAG